MMLLPQSVRAYAMAKRRAWPSLYGHDNVDHGILAALNQLYFTLGNGIDWKEGKPKRYKLNKRARELAYKLDPEHKPSYIPKPYCGAVYGQIPPEKMSTNWLKGYIWALEHFYFYSLSGAYERECADCPQYLRDFVYRELKDRVGFEDHLRDLLNYAYAELRNR